MRFLADLHVHSSFSRATSRDMSPEALWRWAQLKGLAVVGTGDFTHPSWRAELGRKLEPLGSGLLALKKKWQAQEVPEPCRATVFFMLTAEVSCIYRKRDRTRKVHCLVFVPGLSDAERISAALARRGNIASDGRPIIGMDAKDLLALALDACPASLVVPAHAWTPHFSVFGAVSGFDSLEECFEELTPHITAIETGLSSDPPMNWRLSSLDAVSLLSNSDAHSPSKIGREATIFDTEPTYQAIWDSVRTRQGLMGTIEFFPEEGKYHFDGHRACGVRLSPAETIRHRNICPVCGRKVTIGVMHRVDALADRPAGFTPPGAPDFSSLIPLQEIIAGTLGVGVNTRSVAREYMRLLSSLGNEFTILLDTAIEDIAEAGSPRLSDAVGRMRRREVSVSPGFDGEYGTVHIFPRIGSEKGQERHFRGLTT